MKKLLPVVVAMVVFSAFADYSPEEWNLNARQKFADQRFGIFIHWGLYATYAQGEWFLEEAGLDEGAYASAKDGFYPSCFNAGEWVDLFKRAGARYVTMTARHHDGFSLWPSQADDGCNIANTPFKRDVIGEMAAACATNGLQLNLYYSLLDWHRKDYPTWHDAPPGLPPMDWGFDEIYDLIHFRKTLVANNHHRKIREKEDIQIFERDVPGENRAGYSGGQGVSRTRPLEQCDVIQKKVWGYRIGEKEFRTAEDVCAMICRAAAKGSNLLLNIGPDGAGRLPARAVEVLTDVGTWMSVNGKAIYGTRGAGFQTNADGTETAKTCKGDKVYVFTLRKGEYPVLRD